MQSYIQNGLSLLLLLYNLVAGEMRDVFILYI